MNLPGLLVAPFLALIVLVLFLAFWVFVVICIATASAPGDKNPFAPLDNTAAHATTTDVTLTNTGSKSKFVYILLVYYIIVFDKWHSCYIYIFMYVFMTDASRST